MYRLGYGTRSALDKVRQASKQSLFDLRVQPGVRMGDDPSVPMKMRHGAAGNLDLRARKVISHMPMQQTPDGEAGAAASGGRRPTVVTAPASPSPELSDRPRRRTFTAQDKLRILAETDPPRRPVVSARSYVARDFTHRLSLTGDGSVTPGPSQHWFPASAGRRLPTRARFQPK